MVHNAKIKLISLAVWLSLSPLGAEAAGLGKLTVISALGEPLNAEVELLSATKEELSSLTAQIAPGEVYAEQGLERASILSAVRVELGKRPDGTPVLRLGSSQPINDPFLDMLLQVEWSSGRLLREYTALLDPPGFSNGKVVGTIPESTSLPGTSTKPAGTKDVAPSKSGKSVVPENSGAAEHIVRKGDTLHAIASQNQVDGVSLEQMLVGIYRANQSAFAGNNMNRLKVGQILRIPEQSELQAVSKAEAVKEIRVQAANWNAYRTKLAGMAETAAPAPEESGRSASGKISAPAEDKSTKPEAGPHDVVKLSRSESAATSKADAEAAKRLAALQEDAVAREKALNEANSRVAALEKQLQDMQKLLEIKNQALAETQKGAQEPKPVQQAPKIESPKPSESAKAESPKPEAAPAPKPKKIVRPVPPPPLPEPSLIDTMLDNPLFLAAGGGLIALLGGAWVLMRNKRKKGLDSFEQGILTTGGIKPDTVFGNTVGGAVDTGTTSFLTDFGQGANAGMIDTNDVDPIAEAEVYMAYGRDAQAEEILKDAIAKDPKRHELHLKLLEIFAQRKDVGAFETLAGELYATVGASDPLWAKAAEIGRGLDSTNPLYGASEAPEASIARTPVEPMDFEATMIQQAPLAKPEELEFETPKEPPTLDFSLDTPPLEETPPSTMDAENNTLDFDLGGLELPEETPVQTTPTSPQEETTLPDLGTSLGALGGESETASSEQAAEEMETALPVSGLDFEFDMPEPPSESAAQLDITDLEAAVQPSQESSPAEVSLELPELEMPMLDAVQAEDATATETPVAEKPTELSLPDLDFPAMETLPASQPESTPEAPAELEMPGVTKLNLSDMSVLEASPEASPAPMAEEFPAFEFPAENEVAIEEVTLSQPELEPAPPAEASELDIDLSGFDLPADGEIVETKAESPQEAPIEEGAGLDFNFDIDLGDLDAAAETPTAKTEPTSEQLSDLDLAGIDLDIASENRSISQAPASEAASSVVESPDVDTKLDLVTAYIDMGDNEGARELLEEVLKEGGPGQREKAQKLLANLG